MVSVGVKDLKWGNHGEIKAFNSKTFKVSILIASICKAANMQLRKYDHKHHKKAQLSLTNPRDAV